MAEIGKHVKKRFSHTVFPNIGEKAKTALREKQAAAIAAQRSRERSKAGSKEPAKPAQAPSPAPSPAPAPVPEQPPVKVLSHAERKKLLTREFIDVCIDLIPFLPQEFPEVPEKSLYKSVLIEPRPMDHLEFLIKNTVQKLGSGWGHIIYCSPLNHNHVKQICSEISPNMDIRLLPASFNSINAYNSLLLDEEFWKSLNCTKALIYQSDTFIVRDLDPEYLTFDYIGSPIGPCSHSATVRGRTGSQHVPVVCNGGLSIRTVQVMIDAIREMGPKFKVPQKIPVQLDCMSEDVFFSFYCYEKGLRLADPFEASLFASGKAPQDIFLPDPDNPPFGYHQPEMFFCSHDITVPENMSLTALMLKSFFRYFTEKRLARIRSFKKTDMSILRNSLYKTKPPIEVSVVISLYNYGAHISKCVNSFIKDNPEAAEIVIVNDHSSDNSLTEAVRIMQSAPVPVTVIDKKINTGASHTRNIGIRNASGKYVFIIDADDYVLPGCLAAHLKKIKEDDADFCYAGVNHRSEYDVSITDYSNEPYSYERLVKGPNYICITGLHDRKALLALGGFDQNMEAWMDYELLLRMGKNGNKVSNIEGTFSRYIGKRNSLTYKGLLLHPVIYDYLRTRYQEAWHIPDETRKLWLTGMAPNRWGRYERDSCRVDLRIVQSRFEPGQPVDPGCHHMDNFAVPGPALYENQYILDLAEAGDHKGHDYWGVTSWRFPQKTNLTFRDIRFFIETDRSRSDAYLYFGGGDPRGLIEHPKAYIGPVLKRLYELKIIPYDNPGLEWVHIFCNYWVARPEVIDRYIKFLKPVADAVLNSKDPVLRGILDTKTLAHREGDYPYHPFILEYMFGLFLYHNPDITYTNIPDVFDSSLHRIYNTFSSDSKDFGDKGTQHMYIGSYNKLFSPLRYDPIKILEIGVMNGHSIKMWREFFPNAQVYGVDINPYNETMDRFTFHQCDQVDAESLHAAFRNIKFDIIVDDGSHFIDHQIKTRLILWEHLADNGLYVVEDIQNPESDIPRMAEVLKPDFVIDTRKLRGRYDDILVVWRKN